MSQVIYARVPDTLKEAADAYAEERGVTLTSAVVDLLGRGMAAASDERSVADLETKLAKTTVEKAKVESKLETAMNELGGLRAFAERAAQEIGKCPKCGEPITGYDLLARGQCRHCDNKLGNLLVPHTAKPLFDEREIGLLLGALGVVLVGAAIIAK